MAAPSPRMKPSRSASKGREARCGSSLRLERAPAAAKPATPMGTMEASAPPATIALTSPRLIISAHSPMASAPLEQAETVQKFGPLAPRRMERCPEAMSAIIIGIKKGLMRDGPRSSSTRNCCDSVPMPPMPLPTMTPISVALRSSIWSPELAMASTAAAIASWTKRSVWRASFRSMKRRGSKPLTSAAIFVAKVSASKAEIRSTPDFPARSASHVEALSRPRGLTTPMPVTATRCPVPLSIPAPAFVAAVGGARPTSRLQKGAAVRQPHGLLRWLRGRSVAPV